MPTKIGKFFNVFLKNHFACLLRIKKHITTMRHIKSLKNILDVATTSNAVRLAKEIEQFLFEYARNVEIFRQQNPEITKGLKNTEIIKGSFKFSDDDF